MKLNKKGQVFDNLGALAIGVVTLAIVLVVAFMVMSNTNDMLEGTMGCKGNASSTTQVWTYNGTTCCLSGAATCISENTSDVRSEAANSTRDLRNATSDVPDWVPIVVITAIGSILIGMVAAFRR